jgi:GTP-binding protein
MMSARTSHHSPPVTKDSVPGAQDPARTPEDSGPAPQDAALVTRHAALVTIKTAEFETSAVRPRQYPAGDLPEVAFAGRSNVGKSSLINCLTQRKKLVRTSRTPGLTQLINFFKINGAFYFVDLPGYGFARVPEHIRAQWKPMVEAYLVGRKTLRGIVHIMDARHLPTPDDVQLWNWLKNSRIPAIPVLTKADKMAQGKRSSRVKAAVQGLGVPREQMVLFSSATGLGREELLEKIMLLLDSPRPAEEGSPEK